MAESGHAVRQESDSTAKAIRAAKDFGAGWFGGIAQVLSGQPFDTVKVRLQTQGTGELAKYKGPLDCLLKTVRSEGVSGLYRGTLMPLMGVGLCVSIQFSALEAMKRLCAAPSTSATGPAELTLAQLFASGSVAGLANTAVAGPVEHIRIRCQVASASANADVLGSRGPMAAVRDIYRQAGLRGIYLGQSATLIRDGIGYGAYFLAYEYLVQSAIGRMRANTHDPSYSRGMLPSWQLISFGAAAGISFWLVVYPADVVKSKMQTDAIVPGQRRYKGLFDCFAKVWRAEGPAGLFRGFSPCLMRSAPVNATTFVAFEMAMRYLA